MRYLKIILIILLLCFSISAQTKDGSLSVEAALTRGNGKILLVAGARFYLLDESLMKILEDARVESPSSKNSAEPGFDLISDIHGAFAPQSSAERSSRKLVTKVLKAISPHIVATFVTDAAGKATVTGLEKRTFFLFGVGGAGDASAFWDVTINISEKTALKLDQDNATQVL